MDRLTLTLTQAEFDRLRVLQRKKRWGWPAVFSTNCDGDIWPFVTRSHTPEVEREPVRGLSRVIDEVADFYLKVRREGGRFFIDDLGASHKGDDLCGPLNLFVRFEITHEGFSERKG